MSPYISTVIPNEHPVQRFSRVFGGFGHWRSSPLRSAGYSCRGLILDSDRAHRGFVSVFVGLQQGVVTAASGWDSARSHKLVSQSVRFSRVHDTIENPICMDPSQTAGLQVPNAIL